MKKITLSVFIVLVFAVVFSACSKSPVGPSMSSMSISTSPSTSTTAATTCVSSTSGGSTSVNTVLTGVVSTQQGDTGVSSIDVSTGVSASVSGGTSVGGGTSTGATTGGTLNMTLDSSGSSAWGAVTISAGSSPRLSWTVSGVTGISSYEILAYSLTNYTTAWDVTYSNVSITSVVFGVAPSGATVTTAPTALKAGMYNVIVHARNSSNFLIGYANGIITVK